MANRKLLLLIVSALVVLAIPILLFSESRQAQIESFVTDTEFQNNKPLAAVTLIGLFAADILLPIPSSAVCAVAGFVFGFLPGALICWVGLNLSALIGYWLGCTLGWKAVETWSESESVFQAREQMDRWGVWPLIAFRALPVLAEASILMLGTYRYPQKKFWPAILIANLLVAVVFVGMGKWFADQEQFILGLIVCCVLPPIGLMIWLRLFSNKA